MIKASDVRPGNKLIGHLTGEIVTVDWLVIKHLQSGNVQAPPYDERPVYEPIPLTPEILEACGFEIGCLVKTLTQDWFIGRDEKGVFIQIERERTDEVYVTERVDLAHINYLHQLQNLWHSLANTELQIDEKIFRKTEAH